MQAYPWQKETKRVQSVGWSFRLYCNLFPLMWVYGGTWVHRLLPYVFPPGQLRMWSNPLFSHSTLILKGCFLSLESVNFFLQHQGLSRVHRMAKRSSANIQTSSSTFELPSQKLLAYHAQTSTISSRAMFLQTMLWKRYLQWAVRKVISLFGAPQQAFIKATWNSLSYVKRHMRYRPTSQSRSARRPTLTNISEKLEVISGAVT